MPSDTILMYYMNYDIRAQTNSLVPVIFKVIWTVFLHFFAFAFKQIPNSKSNFKENELCHWDDIMCTLGYGLRFWVSKNGNY